MEKFLTLLMFLVFVAFCYLASTAGGGGEAVVDHGTWRFAGIEMPIRIGDGCFSGGGTVTFGAWQLVAEADKTMTINAATPASQKNLM